MFFLRSYGLHWNLHILEASDNLKLRLILKVSEKINANFYFIVVNNYINGQRKYLSNATNNH